MRTPKQRATVPEAERMKALRETLTLAVARSRVLRQRLDEKLQEYRNRHDVTRDAELRDDERDAAIEQDAP